ncbi:MAG: thioredoxin family protein, partial [Pseudomonadota bacterium]|nr:thioredoxin family protein [Pseudomonadota bacterium]
PEAKPFGDPARAAADVAAALARAKANGHRIILVFGANWCHDSRALAGWFATPRFAAMLAPRYELVWIDVGQKDKNLDLARHFGLDGIKGTPTVLVVDSDGHPVNLADAPSWHDASTRSEAAIYDYFARLAGGPIAQPSSRKA